jgi:predicted short-subunit dehydrogenase-like oxidoreductase (DUF2520 family)
VGIVGSGRVATAVAVLLERSGYRVLAASGREASRDRVGRFLPTAEFFAPEIAAQVAKHAEVVMIGVPDDAIAPTAAAIGEGSGFRSGQHVLHLSGSVGLDAIEVAEHAGAEVLSAHPLQSFPTVERGIERFPGSGMAITARSEEGFAFGEALAQDAGAIPFRVAEGMKPLYHAAAVFCANYLVTIEAMAEQLFRAAGVADPLPLFAPLARAVLDRTIDEGPAAALTGPAVRGDVGTVRRNLEALARYSPAAVSAYVALARVALEVASQNDGQTEAHRRLIELELDRWK